MSSGDPQPGQPPVSPPGHQQAQYAAQQSAPQQPQAPVGYYPPPRYPAAAYYPPPQPAPGYQLHPTGPVGPPPAMRGPVNPTDRPARRRAVLLGAMFVVFAICFLLLAALYGWQFGLGTTIIAGAAAVLPLFVVIPVYLWIDRYEAEPLRFILFAFFWGALCAPVGALVLNTGAEIALVLLNQASPDTIGAVVIAPPVEEGLKGMALLLIVWLRRHQFDSVLDGIFYAGMVGAGFAFSENILYLGRALSEGGVQSLTVLFVLRCVLAPFAHPLFTSMTGLGLGLAVSRFRSVPAKVGITVLGFVCAVLLHATWNLTAVLDAYFTGYFFLQVPIFLAFIALAIWLRVREKRVIATYLRQYADAGWFTYPEVQVLSDLRLRRSARAWARTQGPGAGKQMAALQDSATELALLRSRINRGAESPDAAQRERALLESITRLRVRFLPLAGQVAFAATRYDRPEPA